MQDKPFCFEEYQFRSDHKSPGKDQPPLAGLRQARSQDFVLRTASWAKVSRPSGAIAKQLQDGAGYFG
jgi:hypothetical protein